MHSDFHPPRRSLLPALAVASCLLLPSPAATGPLDAHRVERTVWLMGTEARIRVEAPTESQALAASEAAVDAMAEVESLLSTWREDSELSRLNRTDVGRWARPGRRVAGWLRETALLSTATGGAVHPAVGALVDAWELRGEGRVPGAEEQAAARAASGPPGITVDPATGAFVRRSADAWMDAGAFGKGAALRMARLRMEEAGATAATVDLGGQILHLGTEAIVVSMAHPSHRAHPAARLRIAGASLATSGQSERGFDVDGTRFGHVLDPRTGHPVPAWGSVTVIDDDPLTADVLSTALFVMGPDDGFHWAAEEGVAALFLSHHSEAGLTARGTPALVEYLEQPLPGGESRTHRP